MAPDPEWREKLTLKAQIEKLKLERKNVREGKPKNSRSAAAKRAWITKRHQPCRPTTEAAEMPQLPSTAPIRAGQTIVERYNLYPQEMKVEHDAFLSELYSDLGGEAELSLLEKTLAKRIAMLEVLINLYGIDLAVRGALTVKGKVRSTIDAMNKAIDRQERIGKQLGWKRRTKEIGGTIEDRIRQFQAAQANG